MKKSVLITLIVLAIFIIIDIFLWWNYQNIQRISKTTNVNLNRPISIQNENLNIAPIILSPQIEQDKNKINEIIDNAANQPMSSIGEISDQIINALPPEDIESSLMANTDEPDNYKKYIALNTLFLQEIDKEEKSPNAIKALKKYMTDPDFSVRFEAADILVMLGDKEGLPILIQGLNNHEIMPFSEPPFTYSQEANQMLQQTTGKNFGYDIDKWIAWWQLNKELLNYNYKKSIFE